MIRCRRAPLTSTGIGALAALAALATGCHDETTSPTVPTPQASETLTLIATKTYNPSTWYHDERSLPAPVSFTVPDELPVTVGNAGNHQASLRYRLGDAATVTCTYRGGSDQSHPKGEVQIQKGLRYLLQGCTDGATGGDTRQADYVRLSIANGDSWAPSKDAAQTTVEVDLKAEALGALQLVVTPGQVLFTGPGQQRTLAVRAFYDSGQEVDVDSLAIEWVTTRPGDIALVDHGDGTVTVSNTVEVGYSVVIARATALDGLYAPPVAVRAARLQPGARALADADVLFPPPTILPGQTAAELPGFSVQGDDVLIGSFTLLELLTRIAVVDDQGIRRLRYPIVIAASAHDPAATAVVSAGAGELAARVLGAEVRGDWVLLQAEAASPIEIYLDYEYFYDGPALAADGLVPETLAASPTAAASASPLAPLISGPFDDVIPPGFERFNDVPCAGGQLDAIRITGLSPTVKPSIIQPRGGLTIGGGQQTFFMFYGGLRIEAFIRPEVDVQANGKLGIDCYIGPEIGSTLGFSALTASTVDGRWKFKPRLRASVEVAGGPRVNGFALVRAEVKATIGLRYENGQWHGSDGVVGQYNDFAPRLDEPQFQATGSWDADDLDLLVDARLGIVGEKTLSLQLGGVIAERLQRVLDAASDAEQLTDAVLATLERVGLQGLSAGGVQLVDLDDFGGLTSLLAAGRLADVLLQILDLELLRAELPFELRQRAESGRRVLNEADNNAWFANEHQIFGVQSQPSVSLGLLSFERIAEQILSLDFPDALTFEIATPPLDLFYFYRGIENNDSIQHEVVKGAGNQADTFEVGDRIHVDVPARWGVSQTGLNLSDPALVTPTRATAHLRGPGTYTQVAELSYRGMRAGLHRFDGYVEVTADNVAALNAFEPIYFLGWNRMGLLDIPGYLSSIDDYTISGVRLQAPATLELTQAVGELAEASIAVANRSRQAGVEVPVEAVITAAPAWLAVDPTAGTLAPNSSTRLDVTAECGEEGTFEGSITVVGEILDAAGQPVASGERTIAVTLDCRDIDCPWGAIPNPTGVTDCACDSENGYIVVPGTNDCQCDSNRGYQYDSAADSCTSCGDRDPTRPYWNDDSRQCEACPVGAVPNPTGVTPCACDSSRGFFIAAPDSPDPDSCECAADTPRYDPAQDRCVACPTDSPVYNPTTARCQPGCDDPAAPFYDHAAGQCRACPSDLPSWNPGLMVCERGCPGGTQSGDNEPFTGSYELGTTSGVFTFSRTHYTIKDRIKVLYEGRVLHDTGCTGGSETKLLSYAGSSTNVLVKVEPSCAGGSTLWNFSVTCPE